MSSICGLIITFYPQEITINNIRKVLSQVDTLIVFDNTPGGAQNLLELKGIPNVKLVQVGQNQGVAIALNYGLNFAKANRFEWLATFDQDSQPAPNMITQLLTAWKAYPLQSEVLILALIYKDPKYADSAIALNVEEKKQKNEVLEKTSVITSGNLIQIIGISDAIQFDEDLFIDYVDHDFCLQARKYKRRILEVPSATMLHSLGDIDYHDLGGYQVHVTNHAPIRHYYLMRNRLYVWLKYFDSFPVWVAKDIFSTLKMVVRMALFERDRYERFKYLLLGVRGFMSGEKGICPKKYLIDSRFLNDSL